MSAGISVSHGFEAGHRLPHITGKCQSLHGHSWRTTVEVSAPMVDYRGMVVEFGPFKQRLRSWIDAQLDHGVMLGHADPLLPILDQYGKVWSFEGRDGEWPTVENVAVLIHRIASDLLISVLHVADARVSRVTVQETPVNAAWWEGSA